MSQRPNLVPGVTARYGAVDVHYPESGGACAALVVAHDPTFATIAEEKACRLADVAPYEPGRFFARELPAVRAVVAQAGALDLLVIDGYVDLDPSGRPGLGAHVHAELRIPVVGVAKTAFRSATHAIPVRRNAVARPLYITAAGIPVGEAAALVTRMAGDYRIPDALRRVDKLARTATVR